MRAADVDVHIGADTSDAEKGFSRVDGLISSIGGNFIGGMAVKGFDFLTSSLGGLAGGFIMANANAETMRMSLEVATGSAEKADKVYGQLMTMAKNTPFEFPELMQSAVMLESMGNNAMDYIGVIGDASAATGKSIDQTTNAFLDAQTGEFERLKEYGIKVVDEGGKTYMEYMKNGQMVRKEIDRNNQEMISSTLAAIWNDKYGGAMEKQSQTFMGQWSTLKDNLNMTMQAMSKPVFDFAKKGLEAANGFFTQFDQLRGQGISGIDAFAVSLQSALMKMFGVHTGMIIMQFVNMIINGIQTIIPIVQAVASAIGSAFSAIGSFIENNLTAVMGAIKGIGLAVGIITAVTAAFFIMGAAIALVTSPIFLIIAAFALLGAAYATNFMGFADGVNAVAGMVTAGFQVIVSAVQSAVSYLQNAFSGGWISGLLNIANDIAGLGDKFTPLKQSFQELSTFIMYLIPVIMSFKDAFQSLMKGDFSGAWNSFKNGVKGAMEAGRQFLLFLATLRSQLLGLAQAGVEKLFSKLASMFPGFADSIRLIGSAFSNLISMAKNLSEAFESLMRGDLEGFFSNIGQAAIDAVQTILAAFFAVPSLIVDIFNAIDWGAVWNGLKSAASATWDAIKAGFSALMDSISASGIGQAIGDMLSDAFNGAKSMISGWLSSVGSMISSGLQAASDWVVTSFQAAWDSIASLDWADWIDPLAWADWIGGKIADIGTWVWDKIKGFFPSASVITGTLGDIGDWIWTKISGFFPAAAVIGGAIADIGNWIWTKIQAYFPQASIIAGGISNIATWVWDKISKFFPQAAVIGGAAIADIGNWIWTKISRYFPNASIIAGGIQDIASWVWTKISGFFPSGSVISGTVGDIGDWLYKKLGSPSISIPDFPGWKTIAGWIFGFGGDGGGSGSKGPGTISAGDLLTDPSKVWDYIYQQRVKQAQKAQPGSIPGQTDGPDKPGQGDPDAPQATPYIPPSGPQGLAQTFTIKALDLATPTVNQVKAALLGIPPEKRSQISQQGGEQVSLTSQNIRNALENIPQSKMTSIAQNGGEAVSMTSQNIRTALDNIPQQKRTALSAIGGAEVQETTQGIKANINDIPATKSTKISFLESLIAIAAAQATKKAVMDIPDSHMTSITEMGGAVVTGSSNTATNAIRNIPTSHFTSITESGAASVTSNSNTATNAIRNIPTSHFTSISESGGYAVASAAYAAANAINSIPSSKFVSFGASGVDSIINAANAAAAAINSVPSSKSVSIRAYAGGGYTQGSIVSLAEQGRELLRFPWGDLAMAMRPGLYQVPEGTFVYTNPETEAIIGKLDNIEHYAQGGWVGGPVPVPESARTGGGAKEIYLITSPELFHTIADAVETVKVITDPSELDTIFQ